MTAGGFLRMPEGDDKDALLKLVGKDTITLLKFWASQALPPEVVPYANASLDLLSSVGGFFYRLHQERIKKRLPEFSEQLLKSGPEVTAGLEKMKPGDPLADTFAFVVRQLLQDDEDEKTQFYAALMAGLLTSKGQGLNNTERLALLRAVSDLRVHELHVFALACSTKYTSHNTQFSISAMKDHFQAHGKYPVHWNLAKVALATLAGGGLIRQDLKRITAPVPPPEYYYELEEFGILLFETMILSLVPEGHTA